jgi:hypothetical protein
VIPNDTENLTGETTAVVTIEITGLETRDLISSNIQVSNVTDGYSATIITQSLPVTIRGKGRYPSTCKCLQYPHRCGFERAWQHDGIFTVRAKVYVDGYTDVGAVGRV